MKPASIFGFTDETGIALGLVVASAVKFFNAYTAACSFVDETGNACGVHERRMGEVFPCMLRKCIVCRSGGGAAGSGGSADPPML